MESSILDTITAARRPGFCTAGRPIQLAANFYKFTTLNSTSIYKHAVAFEPEVPAQMGKLRDRILSKGRAQVLERVGKYVYANTALYSGSVWSEPEFQVTSTYDNVNYTITITSVGEVEGVESRHFYNKFFNTLQGKLSLVMIGRKFYNPERSIELRQHNMSIWPGYVSAVGSYSAGCLVNIDISHRCLRTISLLQELDTLRSSDHSGFRDAAMRKYVGTTVLTRYNNRTYHVDDIDWSIAPTSTFKDDQGKEHTYKDYYQRRWNYAIQHNDQPLLVTTVKRNKIYLIPELCYVSGITDDIRANFNIMKDMANSTKKEPGERLKECGNLISTALANPKSQGDISDWKVHLSPVPVELEGRVLDAGQIAMGKNMSFNINPSTGSFDRDVQKKMFEQPELKMWGVFHMENDRRLVDSFMGILQQVIQQFEVQCQKPITVPIRGDRWDEWDRILREKLNPQVQLIICILPGQRGKSRLYDDLKRLTFSRLPVPTQCILNGTLKKDKGLRSVVNKVMMQINAKVGGVPWALKNLPYGDRPTMVVGIDVYHKKGAYSVLGFCATTDRYFSKYTSVAKVHMESQEMVTSFKIAMIEAITQFKSDNGMPPQRVIIFRDGVSDSQRSIVLATEVAQIKSAFLECKTSGVLSEIPTCSFLVVNKRINARFFAKQGDSFSNPPLGTCVDTVVSEKEGYDFFITPAKATQGAMTPTHFHVIYDDTGRSCNEIEELTYRLCYSYYNWSGSIRVPAPCQYAHKLAYAYGERATREGPPAPHNHWSTTRSLYFL